MVDDNQAGSGREGEKGLASRSVVFDFELGGAAKRRRSRCNIAVAMKIHHQLTSSALLLAVGPWPNVYGLKFFGGARYFNHSRW